MSNQADTSQPGKKKAWYKRKRFIIPAAFVAVIVVVSAAGGGSDSAKDSAAEGLKDGAGQSTSTTEVAALYPNRPDRQKGDREAAVGSAVEFSGYTTTVKSAGFQQSISDFEKDGYIVIEVTVKNRDAKAQPYNQYDWRIQTPNGQVLDPAFATIDGQLQSGDLVKDGEVSGKIAFKAGSTKGDFYAIYKPDAYKSDRGIWKVTV